MIAVNYSLSDRPTWKDGSYTSVIQPGLASNTTFNIDIIYSGDPVYLAAVEAAAQRWEQVITGDLPDVVSATYGAIDDLLIHVNVGAFGFSQGQPDEYRSDSLLPAMARFNTPRPRRQRVLPTEP
jgi:hypothetical protein